ncbi:MAG: hypothetical protein HY751_08535 [Nitrospinae bacterium]|nr:hypothetical protein [Nitrospinota bacterium]
MGKKKAQTTVKEKAKKTPSAKAEKPKRGGEKPVEKPVPAKPGNDELEALRRTVLEAKAKLDNAQAEAKKVEENVRQLVAREKDAYLKVLIPYRDACKKAGVECEFGGGRLANVSERVTFLVEKVDKGIKVAIKGRPETEEVIPFAKLKESVTRASYDYTDRHIGPKEETGNKGGGLSNRLRALLK